MNIRNVCFLLLNPPPFPFVANSMVDFADPVILQMYVAEIS